MVLVFVTVNDEEFNSAVLPTSILKEADEGSNEAGVSLVSGAGSVTIIDTVSEALVGSEYVNV